MYPIGGVGTDRWEMAEVVVRISSELRDEISPGGMVRARVFDDPNVTVTRSRVPPGGVAEWHHHGERELYGFGIRGTLRVEFGPGGSRHVLIHPGDFFRVPRGLIHRDLNLDAHEPADVTAVLVGPGPLRVDVNGPEP